MDMNMRGLEGFDQVGEIGVDAGLCWIGDPCYCVTPDATEHPAESWTDFCKKLRANENDGVMQWHYKRGHAGLGVSVSSGYGDGVYPVYVKRNNEGRVVAALVVFD